jgi:hypothetical protein
MSEHHPTRSLPFGRDVSTLILCRDEDHRRKVIAALQVPARYELIYSPLTGYRFKKIIVVGCRPASDSKAEAAAFQLLLTEHLPTKLDVGCHREIYVI